MSYTTDRIARRMAESAEFRAAYEQQLREEAEEQARRERVMKRFADARKARKLSQSQLGETLKISQERLSQIERGVETLSVDRLLDLAAALGLHIAILNEEDVHRHGLESFVATSELSRPIGPRGTRARVKDAEANPAGNPGRRKGRATVV